jgi:hypothetical protein
MDRSGVVFSSDFARARAALSTTIQGINTQQFPRATFLFSKRAGLPRGDLTQQQPHVLPCKAVRPSFKSNGTATSAASESNQGIWKSALIARPAKAITAR